MEAYVNESKIYKKYDELEHKLKTMKTQNEYDLLRKNTVERFLEYGRFDVKSGQYERSVQIIDTLENLLRKKTVNVSGKIYHYKTHKAKIDGFSMCDDTNRPVFYVGYGHFNTVREDIESFHKFGVNTIQIEIGPSNLLFRKGTHEKWGVEKTEYFKDGEKYLYTDGIFEIHLADLYKDIIPVLRRAEKNNIAVSLLISPHYMPAWMYEDYPDIRSKTVGFFGYNIYHPMAKEMLRVYVDALIPMVKDFKSLQSIFISNEPAFDTSADRIDNDVNKHDLLPTSADTSYTLNTTLDLWQDYLKNKFISIETFNKVFNMHFKNFQSIKIPIMDDGSALYYEWTIWNNKMLASWHSELAEMIRKIAPDIPICSKIMPIFGTSEIPFHRRFISYGTDPEEFAKFSQISGNDAWSFYGREHLPLTYKLEWYDFLASIKQMPIDNAEDHIIEDRDEDYSPIQAKRIYADMWQGAVHGRTLTQIWVWERANNQRSNAYGSILHRPDCVEAVGRASLDLNRLAYEVTYLQNAKPTVAVFYSKSSRVYDKEHVADVFKAYEAVLFSGNKVHFVTENRISEIHDYDLLVLPNVSSISQTAFNELIKYTNSNKKILVIDRKGKSLMYDEYKRERKRHSLLICENVKSVKADIMKKSPNLDYTRQLTTIIKDLMIKNIDLILDDTYNVEWFLCEANGKQFISVCNHNEHMVTFSIRKENSFVQSIDLITNIKYGENVILDSYQCAFLELKKENKA